MSAYLDLEEHQHLSLIVPRNRKIEPIKDQSLKVLSGNISLKNGVLSSKELGNSILSWTENGLIQSTTISVRDVESIVLDDRSRLIGMPRFSLSKHKIWALDQHG